MNYAQLMQQGISNPAHSMANGGGSGGGSSSTVASIAPELKPLAKKYAADAMTLSDKAYTPYTGERYAGLNGAQNSALDMIQNRAANGSATVNNAESQLNQMMDGGSNPYLDASVQKALGSVQSRVNSQFSGNNYGSSAHQEILGESLGNTANQMYSDAYNNDQNRRLSAISQAPTFGNQAYTDASQMLNAGQIQQDQAQQGLDFDYTQFQDLQNDPYKKLAAMSGVFNSNLGNQSTTTQSGGGK